MTVRDPAALSCGCRLSPAVLAPPAVRAASVPYTVAGAQCWVLRRRGVAGGRAEGSPAAEPCGPEGSSGPRGPEDRRAHGWAGKGEDGFACARGGEAR